MSLLKKATMLGAAGTAASGGLYVEDVFSTYLYSGNGSTKTITNGIDLDGEGGLVWIKPRTNTNNHRLHDTERGAGFVLASNLSSSSQSLSNGVTSFNSNGFTLGTNSTYNGSNVDFASWTFRKAPKFFDIVTYTGSGDNANRTVAHNLGMKPGLVIIKRIDSIGSWITTHRSLPLNEYLSLEETYGSSVYSSNINGHTATHFSARGSDASGGTFVAYLFAHNDGDGGFGENGDQDIIKCGSFTGTATGYADVSLGWEPQFVIIKRSSSADNWRMYDNMRGVVTGGNDAYLYADTSGIESASDRIEFTADGFRFDDDSTYENIYIAIRRPMKTPTSGSEVFAVDAGNTTGSIGFTSGFPVDMAFERHSTSGENTDIGSRLTGPYRLQTNLQSSSESSDTSWKWDFMNGWFNGTAPSTDYISWMWKRAPSFFDVVAYTGTGSTRTVPHSLSVVPELMIVRKRSDTGSWAVNSAYINADARLELQATAAVKAPPEFGDMWNNTRPTSSVFSVSSSGDVNQSGATFIAYLFASLGGISKVGSYTGNGTSQNIDCGFSTGARFVLIKRTDATGDWHLWDTTRGIVTGNDPFLELNTTNVQNSSYDSVDPYSAGFSVNQDAGTNVNVSSGTYIFLAIS